jgi:hypothetical protein
VGGLLLQAGPLPTKALLQWGNLTSPAADKGKAKGKAKGNGHGVGRMGGNRGPGAGAVVPGLLADVFARVGGPDSGEVRAEAMVVLGGDAGPVIGDNLWLWRADHTVQGLVYNGSNPCTNGLIVASDDVTMYGLAVN